VPHPCAFLLAQGWEAITLFKGRINRSGAVAQFRGTASFAEAVLALGFAVFFKSGRVARQFGDAARSGFMKGNDACRAAVCRIHSAKKKK
jgi:hypothetical protein